MTDLYNHGDILYFINGEVPTDDEFQRASKLMGKGPSVVFISLVLHNINELEIKDRIKVAGNVPDKFADVEKAEVIEIQDSEDVPRVPQKITKK